MPAAGVVSRHLLQLRFVSANSSFTAQLEGFDSTKQISKNKRVLLGVPAIEQVHPKRRAFNQKRYNISVLCRFYFYIIFSIA